MHVRRARGTAVRCCARVGCLIELERHRHLRHVKAWQTASIWWFKGCKEGNIYRGKLEEFPSFPVFLKFSPSNRLKASLRFMLVGFQYVPINLDFIAQGLRLNPRLHRRRVKSAGVVLPWSYKEVGPSGNRTQIKLLWNPFNKSSLLIEVSWSLHWRVLVPSLAKTGTMDDEQKTKLMIANWTTSGKCIYQILSDLMLQYSK